MLEIAESVRRELTSRIAQKQKAELGQFMTPARVAHFMASLFSYDHSLPTCRLLDAGAGVGALSCAFLDRWVLGGFDLRDLEVTAYEIDDTLSSYLAQHLAHYKGIKANIIVGDFIQLAAVEGICSQGYTHAILNPPYKKISSQSLHRQSLRAAGIEAVNLYSAFVALAVALAAPGGQVVAVIPRSFCNGPYYRPFRNFILERAAIRQIHLFESRSRMFKDDDVLQENIIIRLECGGHQGRVSVSTSMDGSFDDLKSQEHSFDRIVFPGDTERFIHVPTSKENFSAVSSLINHPLSDLGIKISTGPVVDFRQKEHLCDMPETGTVPLLYPGHFNRGALVWPQVGTKKPNAIQRNGGTEKLLYPKGFYCVVRRFSSKEEKRRVMASVVEPNALDNAPMIGFENHLNLFHENRCGLPQALAHGLAVFLNSTIADESFRRFSGHTQVNATDLKQMMYPSRVVLIALGEWAMQQDSLTQEMIDDKIEMLAT